MGDDDRQPGGDDTGPSPGDLLVIGIDEDIEDPAAAALRHLPAGARIERVNETLSYVGAILPNEADRASVKADLETRSAVRYAEDNHRGHGGFTPNDPRYGDQYAPGMVNAPAAWDVTTGAESVTIAILDSGVKYDHPDLSPNMDDDSHAAPAGASSNYDPTNHGWDFVSAVDQLYEDEDEVRDNDPYPKDLSTTDGDRSEHHGTHVAGIAGAATDNGTGVAGISDCSLLAVKGLDDDNRGWYTDWADGMQWAADQGAEVINMSLGGTTKSQVLKDGVSYASNNGALLVAAAMNQSTNSKYYPAGYPEVMAISALDSNGNLASYSNYGDHIDLAAPGTGVLSTYTTDDNGNPADTYEYGSGTSMATPVVAGVAGLVKSQFPNKSVEELRAHLKVTAEDIGLPENEQGAGRVDAAAAVEPTQTAWTHGVTSRHQFSSPATDGSTLVVGGLQEPLYALDATGGSVEWSYTRDGALVDSSPTIAGTTVFVGSGGGTLYRLQLGDGSEVWTVQLPSAIVSSPTVSQGDVYVGSNDGTVYSVDVIGGSVQWSTDVGAPVYSKPAYYNQTLYVTSVDGRLHALDTAASGSSQWTVDLAGRAGHTSPTVANGRVYAAADLVEARALSDGSIAWQTDHGGTVGSSPTVSDGLVYVGGGDGSIYALDDANAGSVHWSHATGGPVGGTPVLTDWTVVIGSDDGHVYVLDADDGALQKAHSVGRLRSEPAVTSAGVFVCSWLGSTARIANLT